MFIRVFTNNDYFFLHFAVFFMSISGIFSKLAASEPFFSIKFLSFYSCGLLIMAVFTLLWQKILKKLPLTVASYNQSVSLIWSVLWGMLFFGEKLRVNTLIGLFLLIVGIFLTVDNNG